MNLNSFYNQLSQTKLARSVDHFDSMVQAKLTSGRWGDLPKWQKVLEELPNITPSSIDLNASAIRIGQKENCDDATREELESLLRQYHPWRKGPFDIFGIHIDTEWRSDLKWDRLKDQISSLKDKIVLDIGCASGYHCFRAAAYNPKIVMGIDPTMLYVLQFWLFQKYINQPSIGVLPLGIDDMPAKLEAFDSVFSMGLLYHRRSPLDHLLQLKDLLKEGGELVLETLVIDGKLGDTLTPTDRYAMMGNVWFIPSCLTLEQWLKRMGFSNVRLVDQNVTTSEEQRVTDWMGFQSLADFLDPNDSTKTVEGYPAPKRAIFIANK